MHILLTTYGPFRDVSENITEKIADTIQADWDPKDGTLSILNMPVEWDKAEKMLIRALNELKPDLMVAMGHATRYPSISVESRYFNIAVGEDSIDKKRAGEVINVGGKETYETNIDARKLVAHLTSKEVPARLHADKDGMTYLCNFAGYISMEYITQHHLPTKFIFLHIPPPGDIPYQTLVRGVSETISCVTGTHIL